MIRCYWQSKPWNLPKGNVVVFYWTDGEMVLVDGQWEMVDRSNRLRVASDWGIDDQGHDPIEPGFAIEEWIAEEKVAELKALWGIA